ncbi:hypothetical protein SS50377_23302 [Spironucleus salmonicida]|uniref:Uncharacterized protein n=1 Tax=Spironucleus salmonicida TaxID=348837 RepID=V6LU17_9EUKA|nr:hypothetical protein SS50377_23302 [Spironucleus salmonicida]|eukprot:EST47171.1 Hypothetical protein SS50377_12682 [Spironucleus salmonicida]
MNPQQYKSLKQRQSEQQQPRTSRPPPTENWDTYKQDHTKYKLTQAEIESRKQQRAPQQRGNEPLLSRKDFQSKYLDKMYDNQYSDPHERKIKRELDNLLKDTKKDRETEGTTPMEIQRELDDLRQKVAELTASAEPKSVSIAPQVITQDRRSSEQFKSISLDPVLLNSVTKAADKVNSLMIKQTDLDKLVNQLKVENIQLKQDIDDIKLTREKRKEIDEGIETICLDEVLEKLKFI